MRESGAQSKHSTNAYGYQALQDLYLHGRAQAIRCGQWGETLRTAAVFFAAAEADSAFLSASLFFRLAACLAFSFFFAFDEPILACKSQQFT